MSDPTFTALTPEASMQVAVIYLAAAKLDANPEQAEQLLTITGPADPARATAEDARQIADTIQRIMGSAWHLNGRWARRLIAVVRAGTIREPG